jgi:hypothetical protein
VEKSAKLVETDGREQSAELEGKGGLGIIKK